MSQSIRISAVAEVFGDDPRQVGKFALAAGVEGLLFAAKSSLIDLTDLSSTGRREFAKLLDTQGQTLVGLRSDLGAAGFGPGADIDRMLATLKRVMETAAGLQSPLVVIDLGPLPPPPIRVAPRSTITPEQAGIILIPDFSAPPPAPPVPADVPDPASVSRVDGALAELAASADRYGVMLALSSTLSSFASLAEAMDRVRCPWFGVDLDPVAILRDDWNIDEIFSRLGPQIRHVRGRDAAVGADRRTKPMPISRGDTKWGQLFDRLRDADYTGHLSIDPMDLPERAPALKAGIKYLVEIANAE